MKTEKDIHALIAKYLAGEASAQEEYDLRHWVDSNKENEQVFESAFATWEAVHQLPESYHPDSKAAWQNVSAKLDDAAAETKPMRLAGLWKKSWRVAAAIVLLAGSLYLFRDTLWNSGVDSQLQFSAGSEATQYTLPDQSTVWLAPGAELSYEEGEKRALSLSGSAFFEVSRDEQHPFEIRVGETRVEVLGTSFSVEEAEEKIEVKVASGKVAFASKDERILLTPGNKGQFSRKAAGLKKLENQDFNFMPWTKGNLVFFDTPVPVLIQNLEQYFEVEISLAKPQMANCTFTGKYDQPDLDTILDRLALILGWEVERNGPKIVLSGDCDS